MSNVLVPEILLFDADDLATRQGRIVVLVDGDAPTSAGAKRLDRLTRGALRRAMAGEGWGRVKPGEMMELAYPAGLAADALHLVRLPRRTDVASARKAGGAIARLYGAAPVLALVEGHPRHADLLLGLLLRAYSFDVYKSAEKKAKGAVTLMVGDVSAAQTSYAAATALAQGVFLTRDLVNEPANVLTTTEFAHRLTGLRALGVQVDVLDEAELERLGMRLLLGVGVGSECPSHVVVMRWNGGVAG